MDGSTHFVSATCRGERCRVCQEPATHKVGEEIAHDDPHPIRHNLTAYVCCEHFRMVVGRCTFATTRPTDDDAGSAGKAG